jgi:hypothetical protein
LNPLPARIEEGEWLPTPKEEPLYMQSTETEGYAFSVSYGIGCQVAV